MTAQHQEILRLLERVSEIAPEVHLSYLAVGPTNEAIRDLEDEQLVAALRQHSPISRIDPQTSLDGAAQGLETGC